MKTSKKDKKDLGSSEVIGETADKDLLEISEPAPGSKVRGRARKANATAKKSVAAKTKSKAADKAADTSVKKSRISTGTSPVKKPKADRPAAAATANMRSVDEVNLTLEVDPLAAMSPVDRLLAVPALPELERENRARLLMQSPTKLHFYWSVRENPWATLQKALGGETGSYTLVLKLVEMRSGSEQVHRADADGNWWFDVRPEGEYQAEIGFYAPNRPYIRIVYSNVIETPRLKPSPRKAAESDWTISAHKFARVLDVAGFTRDAFDVAVAGDDPAISASAARQALTRFANGPSDRLAMVDDEDIRFAMLAFAKGQKLDDLRWKVSSELFDYLQSSEDVLDAQRAEAALRKHFDLDEEELETQETGPAVFGASLVNFPRTLRSRRRPGVGPGVSTEGSHSYRRLFRT